MEDLVDTVEVGFQPNEKRYDLEKAPGGWVELRRLNHGQSNELSDQRLTFRANKEAAEGEAKIATKEGRHFAFSKCIKDHNLTSGGTKVDFTKRRGVDGIDPIVGDEIADLIDTHNETLQEAGDVPN